MINNLEILKQTVWIYSFVFTAAGLITAAFRSTSWGRNITVAIITWFIIFALFVFGAYLGWLPFSVVILLISYGAVREFFVLNGIYNKFSLGIIITLLIGMAVCIGTGRTYLFYYIPGLAIFIFFPVYLFTRSWQGIVKTVSLQVLGIIYWGWLPMHFLLLHRLEGGYGAIILLCTMIALNDNTAYYVGKLLGKNSPKLAPKISPNKTWIGFMGGTCATIASALLFAYALPHVTFLQRLALGGITALAIPVGDLIESAMKRDLGVKDSGFIIPGHGGVMDRFDSWAFTTPVVYYFLLLLSKWNN